MGTVTELPCNARVLNAVREEVGMIARRHGRSEAERRSAFARALRLMADGASSAWAIQAARQDLREPRIRMCGTTGPEAA